MCWGRRRVREMLHGTMNARPGVLGGRITLRRGRRREREKRTAQQTGGEEVLLESKNSRSWVIALAR